MKTILAALFLFAALPIHASTGGYDHLKADLDNARNGDEAALMAARKTLGSVPGLESLGRMNAMEFKKASGTIQVAQGKCTVILTFKDSTNQTIRWEAESSNPQADICYYKDRFGAYGDFKATVIPSGTGSSR